MFSKVFLPTSLGLHLLLAAAAVVTFGPNFYEAPRGAKSFGTPTVFEITRSISTQVSSKVLADPEEKKIVTPGIVDGTNSNEIIGMADGNIVSSRDRYIHELRTLLESRKQYPRLSRQMREEGQVTIRMEVLRYGEIKFVELVKPSHFERLNEAAQNLVSGVGRYKPFPVEMQEASVQIDVPIRYTLN